MTDYEIIWNGSMRETYLCVRQPPMPTFTGTPIPMPEMMDRPPVADYLPIRRQDAITTPQLMARSGATYAVVAQTLYRLRKRGELAWDIRPAIKSGHPPRAYWRVRGALSLRAEERA